MRAVLSVGSNKGDRQEHLRSVIRDFAEEVLAVSPLYSTPPWGGVEQPHFYNAVILLETERTPHTLLYACQALENAALRRREQHWGPRTLDVDIVTCVRDGVEVQSEIPQLILPHPYAKERAFVLVPWLAVDSMATLGGRAIADLVAELDTRDITMVAKEWV
ncbi:MAG: 2-amino-4-hydroxy-6-hydroxymethyldihydropteridine diphosphokinase [Corynebacterium sp.]|nr:2-amino-4-hydroxy-6-hydroxymethyldihydropteridine diphosphokinase [Corynebacterium sp.]